MDWGICNRWQFVYARSITLIFPLVFGSSPSLCVFFLLCFLLLPLSSNDCSVTIMQQPVSVLSPALLYQQPLCLQHVSQLSQLSQQAPSYHGDVTLGLVEHSGPWRLHLCMRRCRGLWLHLEVSTGVLPVRSRFAQSLNGVLHLTSSVSRRFSGAAASRLGRLARFVRPARQNP